MVLWKLAGCFVVALLVSFGVFAESVIREKLAPAGRLTSLSDADADAVGRVSTARDKAAAQATIASLRALSVALETYAIDSYVYPQAADMDALAAILSPRYMKDVPRDDRWDKPLVYLVSEDGMQYRLVSGGADGKIESASRTLGAPVTKGSDDLILENGELLTEK